MALCIHHQPDEEIVLLIGFNISYLHYSVVNGRENEPWNEEDMFSWAVISLVCVDNKEGSTNCGTVSRIRRQQEPLHCPTM